MSTKLGGEGTAETSWPSALLPVVVVVVSTFGSPGPKETGLQQDLQGSMEGSRIRDLLVEKANQNLRASGSSVRLGRGLPGCRKQFVFSGQPRALLMVKIPLDSKRPPTWPTSTQRKEAVFSQAVPIFVTPSWCSSETQNATDGSRIEQKAPRSEFRRGIAF